MDHAVKVVGVDEVRAPDARSRQERMRASGRAAYYF